MKILEQSASASGSVSQKYGCSDPDPHPDPYQNVMDAIMRNTAGRDRKTGPAFKNRPVPGTDQTLLFFQCHFNNFFLFVCVGESKRFTKSLYYYTEGRFSKWKINIKFCLHI